MGVYFSPAEGGFFHDAIHGEQSVLEHDPEWTPPARPMIALVSNGVAIKNEDGEPIMAPDWEWRAPEHPTIERVTRPSLIPADAVEITEARWRDLLEGQERGMRIVAGEGGQPTLDDAPPPIEALWRRVRKERSRRLAATDWTQLGDVPPATREAWSAYRQALRDLPATTSDPAAAEWPKSPS